MSELRIRSEAMRDEPWAQPFLPPAVRDDDDPFGDADDFEPLLAATGRALTALFGLAVTVRPGRPPPQADGGAVARVAPVLAGLLATLRLGGDPGRTVDAGGVTLVRHAAAIVAALDAAAASDWPAPSRLSRFDIDIVCTHARGTVEGHVTIIGPPREEPPPPEPVIALRHAILALPMRVRVELAADMQLVANLLPLRMGQILAIAPPLEMPLIVGHHNIGRALVSALPDGRQHAEIVAINVEPMGGRA